jgi:hypothetical protein
MSIVAFLPPMVSVSSVGAKNAWGAKKSTRNTFWALLFPIYLLILTVFLQ